MERAVTIALVTETVDRVGLGGSVTAGGLVNAPLRGRELRELVGGPARPRDELAAAVRTFARQHGRSCSITSSVRLLQAGLHGLLVYEVRGDHVLDRDTDRFVERDLVRRLP